MAKTFLPESGGEARDEQNEGMQGVKAVLPGRAERLGMKKVKE